MQRILYAGLGSLPMLVLGFTLLVVWIDPSSIDDGTWVKAGATLILFEFLLLHSGAFMASGPIVCSETWLRLAWFTGFGLVYGLAMYGFARWTGGSYVFWVLVSVAASRMFTLVLTDDKRGSILMLHRSALGMVILLLTACVCVLPLPQFGLTEAVRVGAFGWGEEGVLVEHPRRFIGWGIAYFLLMGIAELYAGWALPDWTDEQVETAWEALKSEESEALIDRTLRTPGSGGD